jgi:hypothetical protein
MIAGFDRVWIAMSAAAGLLVVALCGSMLRRIGIIEYCNCYGFGDTARPIPPRLVAWAVPLACLGILWIGQEASLAVKPPFEPLYGPLQHAALAFAALLVAAGSLLWPVRAAGSAPAAPASGAPSPARFTGEEALGCDSKGSPVLLRDLESDSRPLLAIALREACRACELLKSDLDALIGAYQHKIRFIIVTDATAPQTTSNSCWLRPVAGSADSIWRVLGTNAFPAGVAIDLQTRAALTPLTYGPKRLRILAALLANQLDPPEARS